MNAEEAIKFILRAAEQARRVEAASSREYAEKLKQQLRQITTPQQAKSLLTNSIGVVMRAMELVDENPGLSEFQALKMVQEELNELPIEAPKRRSLSPNRQKKLPPPTDTENAVESSKRVAATINVGDTIEYDLDRVKQYSTRARYVQSWEGKVSQVHSNGYTVVADGVSFFVNARDVNMERRESKRTAAYEYNPDVGDIVQVTWKDGTGKAKAKIVDLTDDGYLVEFLEDAPESGHSKGEARVLQYEEFKKLGKREEHDQDFGVCSECGKDVTRQEVHMGKSKCHSAPIISEEEWEKKGSKKTAYLDSKDTKQLAMNLLARFPEWHPDNAGEKRVSDAEVLKAAQEYFTKLDSEDVQHIADEASSIISDEYAYGHKWSSRKTSLKREAGWRGGFEPGVIYTISGWDKNKNKIDLSIYDVNNPYTFNTRVEAEKEVERLAERSDADHLVVSKDKNGLTVYEWYRNEIAREVESSKKTAVEKSYNQADLPVGTQVRTRSGHIGIITKHYEDSDPLFAGAVQVRWDSGIFTPEDPARLIKAQMSEGDATSHTVQREFHQEDKRRPTDKTPIKREKYKETPSEKLAAASSLYNKYIKLGYDMAAGKAGTGWMKFDGDTEGQEPGEFATGWTETEQWKYEVAKKILKDLGLDPAAQWSDDQISEYMELEDAWIDGYEEYILKHQNNNKIAAVEQDYITMTNKEGNVAKLYNTGMVEVYRGEICIYRNWFDNQQVAKGELESAGFEVPEG